MNLSEENKKLLDNLLDVVKTASNFESKFEFKSTILGNFPIIAVANQDSSKIVMQINQGSFLKFNSATELAFLIESLNSFLVKLSGEETDVSLIYSSEESRDQLLSTFSEEFKVNMNESEIVETFEEEEHPVKSEEDINAKASSVADSLLFGEIVNGMQDFGEKIIQEESPVLEKEEIVSETITSTSRMIEEVVEITYKDSPEVANGTNPAQQVAEETLYESELSEQPESTTKIDEEGFDDIVIEMKNYSKLHKREFEDLSKLQISGEIVIDNKHLKQIESHINENNDLLASVEESVFDKNYTTIPENAQRWGENAEQIVLIHREYFRIATKESQKALVQGIFDSFNSFTGVDNKVDLMKSYSSFLAEAIGEAEETEEDLSSPGVALPKQKEYSANPKHGEVPLVGEEEDNSATFNPAATMTPEEQAEQSGFISRMEDLENMLTGDYEVVEEEEPTFEKIEKIAKEHGELAAKEYVASLSQEQRDDLHRKRLEEIRLKKEGGIGIASSQSEVKPDVPEQEEASQIE